MYLEFEAYNTSESELQKGIKMCKSLSDLISYNRKMHDLQRYMFRMTMLFGSGCFFREASSLPIRLIFLDLFSFDN